MTDKQINHEQSSVIIDGVDVSGCSCRYYAYDRHFCSIIGDDLCEEHSDCLYKQLKRAEKTVEECHKYQAQLENKLEAKEQECDKLKEDLIEAKAHGDYLNNLALSETLNLVSEQLDQLKRQHQGDKGLITSTGKMNYQLLQEYDKLKTALTEIKEIAKPHQRNIDKICGHCRRYDGCHACCIDDINCYQHKKPTTPACDKYCELKEFEINNIANQILQKISECEVENND